MITVSVLKPNQAVLYYLVFLTEQYHKENPQNIKLSRYYSLYIKQPSFLGQLPI